MLGTFRIWAAPRASLGCSSGLDLRSTALGAAQEALGAAQILNVPSMGCDYNIITYLIKFHCMHGGRTRFICSNAQDCPSRKSPRDFFHGRNFLGTLSVSPRNFCHGRNFLGTLFSTFAHGFWTSSMHTMESYQVCNYVSKMCHSICKNVSKNCQSSKMYQKCVKSPKIFIGQ